MDNKRQELMDVLRRVFSDESSVEALVEAQSVEEIQDLMKKKEVSVTQKDCEFLLAVKDKDFVKALSEMKSNEEVQAAMEEKGFALSADECAVFRIMANRSLMELLTKAKSTEEVRNILEENAITLSPEAYSNLEWDLGVDVELSEDELSNVAGGSWLGLGLMIGGLAMVACGAFGAVAGLAFASNIALGLGAAAIIAGAVVAVVAFCMDTTV